MSKPTKTPGLVSLSFEEWEAKFKPRTNTIASNASFDGLMFETYGAELDFVLTIGNQTHLGGLKLWTLVEGDDGEAVIVEGYHLCNRLGYFVTEKPFKAGMQYNIIL